MIKFSKNRSAKFISHLDTMRTLHRAMRRAGIPISYSKGFNPHASISVAAPLSLGIASDAEYADIETVNYIGEEEIARKMNDTLPEGIRILDVLNVKEKMSPSMALVEGAKYSIKMNTKLNENEIEKVINFILDSETIERIKKTKSGEKLVNIRPLICDIKLRESKNGYIKAECLLSAGSRGSLGPDSIAELLKEFSKGDICGYPEIKREEIYCMKNGEWISMLSYFAGK